MILFEKYHGTGNDFILSKDIKLHVPEVIQGICDRHFGIGADGVMIPEKSEIADIKMTYYNSDGSIAPMCGNGMRCFVYYVINHELVKKTTFSVETLAGIINVSYTGSKLVKVDLGKPRFSLKFPDVDKTIDSGLKMNLTVKNIDVKVHVLFLGTLHMVVFKDENPTLDIQEFGPLLCNHPFFPKQINVNFVEVFDKMTQKVTTYERGAGWTLSCGTGSCASAVVSNLLGKTNNYVKTIVPGGELAVNVGATIELIGPAVKIAEGTYEENII